MRIVLLGPPGAGKGTQAEKLAAQLGIAGLRTTGYVPASVGAGTRLGIEEAKYLDAGDHHVRHADQRSGR